MAAEAKLDRAAIALSALCIVHCVALPLVAVALPFGAVLAEAQWVHWVLAACAMAASVSTLAYAPDARKPWFMVLAIAGLALITGALFLDGSGVDEKVPTVIGGVLLALAHSGRLFRHK